MSKYEESRRMLAQNSKILEALKKIKKQREERSGPRLEEYQELMILHIEGGLDWSPRSDLVRSRYSEILQTHYASYNFKEANRKHLRGYLRQQEEISSVIGWDHLIELIVFVIQGRHGCSISSFYQNLFLKIKDFPKDQWSNIIDRVIQDIRQGKTRGKKRFSLKFSLKNIIEDLGLKQPN